MNFKSFRLLSHQDAESICRAIESGVFADGKATAGGPARDVKQNLQLDRTKTDASELDRTVFHAIQRHSALMHFVMPAKVYAPLYSRYEAGMNYGYHVDGAVMGGLGSLQRTDFAMTVFLRPPATYDGGELVVMQDSGPVEIKLDAGEAFVYPASTLHKVNPVTRGVRLAVVTWMQSLIRHSELREVLYDLRRATDLATKAGEKDLLHLLIKAEQNLIRYGADV